MNSLKLKMLLLFALLLPKENFAQQKFTLSGYVKDARNGEDLIGATVYVKEIKGGTATNLYGFYSLTVPEGEYNVEITYVGYEVQSFNVNLNTDITKNIDLTFELTELNEVIVESEALNSNIVKNQMSVAKLDAKTIKTVPSVLGEADVIRSIQLLPGVTQVADGSAGFNVRGGSADQNLILLDEGTLYNSAHALGLYSVINPDAIKDVKLYKGGIPSRYGGRLSSVLDVRQREGNTKEFQGEAGIGLISSRVLVEGPVVKDKSSFMIAGRRSYGDLFLALTGNDNTAWFYDLNLKTNYTFSEKDRIFLSGYFGRDKFEIGNIFTNEWGNATSTLRWNHLFNDRLFGNFSAIYSNYDYSIDILSAGAEYNLKSNIITYDAKGDFEYFLNDNYRIEFGASNKWYEFRPGEITPIMGSGVAPTELDKKFATEFGAYASLESTFGKLLLKSGVRYSNFARRGRQTINQYLNDQPLVYNAQLGRYEDGEITGTEEFSTGEKIRTFDNFEPRFSATYVINPQNSIKASYNRTNQYIHLVSNSTAPSPLDIWTPSGSFIEPQQADQIAAGYFKNLKDNTYELSGEVYYKWIRNTLDYVDGADLLSNNTLETELLSGDGRSYGLELYLKKNTGKLRGWISYTLSRSERQVTGLGADDPGINNGAYYPTNFDKRNDFSATGIYDLNSKWTFSANFIYSTGIPTTYPSGRFEFAGLSVANFEGRNTQRLPDYHRLDISATLKKPKKNPNRKRGGHEWVFGLYNVYNRKNPTSIFFTQSEDKTENTARQSWLLGITPSVTYNFKF